MTLYRDSRDNLALVKWSILFGWLICGAFFVWGILDSQPPYITPRRYYVHPSNPCPNNPSHYRWQVYDGEIDMDCVYLGHLLHDTVQGLPH